jgi:hypothetical protein
MICLDGCTPVDTPIPFGHIWPCARCPHVRCAICGTWAEPVSPAELTEAWDAMLRSRPVEGQTSWLAEKYLDSLPPSIDDVFPTEIRDPLPERHAERDHRPEPCGRCGKTFRTDAGARWHATNNQDCERWARKSRAA